MKSRMATCSQALGGETFRSLIHIENEYVYLLYPNNC